MKRLLSTQSHAMSDAGDRGLAKAGFFHDLTIARAFVAATFNQKNKVNWNPIYGAAMLARNEWQMCPTLPANNPGNVLEGNAVVGSQDHTGLSVGIALANLHDLLIRQLRYPATFAVCSADAISTHHVSGIVGGRSIVNMFRIAARRMVAAMASTNGPKSMRQEKCDATGLQRFFTVAECTVPFAELAGQPRPTRVGAGCLVNTRPKLLNVFRSKLRVRHLVTPSTSRGVRRARSVTALPGTFVSTYSTIFGFSPRETAFGGVS